MHYLTKQRTNLEEYSLAYDVFVTCAVYFPNAEVPGMPSNTVAVILVCGSISTLFLHDVRLRTLTPFITRLHSLHSCYLNNTLHIQPDQDRTYSLSPYVLFVDNYRSTKPLCVVSDIQPVRQARNINGLVKSPTKEVVFTRGPETA